MQMNMTMLPNHVAVAFLIAAILAPFSYYMGLAARALKLPQITGYLVSGIVCGPYLLGILSKESVTDLNIVEGACLSIIGLAAGAELHLPELSRAKKQVGGLLLSVAVCGRRAAQRWRHRRPMPWRPLAGGVCRACGKCGVRARSSHCLPAIGPTCSRASLLRAPLPAAPRRSWASPLASASSRGGCATRRSNGWGTSPTAPAASTTGTSSPWPLWAQRS